MEVLRENFNAELPWIEQAIAECDFIALDAEFSGLHTGPRRGGNMNISLEESYEELRQAATQFMTIQIGVSTFTFDHANNAYVAKPFNFYIYPTTTAGYAPQGRCFMTEASSLDFLAQNGFDFNKWVYQGVHYTTKEEEAAYRITRMRVANNEYQDAIIDEKSAPWIADVMDRITAWLANGYALNYLNIPTMNRYQKKLVYQEVRRRWGDALNLKGGSAAYVTVTKANGNGRAESQQMRIDEAEKDIQSAVGFRAVIDMLSACGKPIAGHNIVIDLAYILAQFVGPLPPTVHGYKQMIHNTFPTILDTKYISYSSPALQGLAFETSLGGLENMVNGVQFINSPRINLHYKHPRYYSRDHSHEAGYDSYLTGVILIKLLAYISKQNMIQREAFYAHQVMYSQASMFPPMHSPMHVPMSAPMLSSIPAPMPVSMAVSAPFVKEPTPEPKAPTPEPAPKVPSPKVEEKTLVPPKKSYADLFSKPKPKPAPAPSPTKPAPTQAKPAPNQAKQAATPAKLANSAKAPVSDKLGKATPPVKEGSLNEKAPNSAQKPAENPKTSTTLAPAPSSPAPAPSPVPLPSPAPRQFHSPPPPPPHHFMGMPLAPFDFKDPAIAVYLNLLHWGRSQSGCFDLKLYG
ncbi:MAG: ribonuclease H-like domain-containing protein [Podila humilis]|nr:MAG: ribonuclease H-like domain-containing protein [Podila humilis]